MQLAQVKVGGITFPNQGDADQSGSQYLRNHGGESNSGNAHLKDDDEEEVEYNVDGAAGKQEEQRSSGVSFGAQDGGAEGINQAEEGADKVDTHIQLAHVDDVAWRGHQLQHGSGHEKAHDHQKQAAVKGHRDGGMDRFFNLLIVSGADVAGNQNVTSHTQTVEQGNQQEAQGAGCSYSSQSLLSRKASDHNGVCCLKQHLQKVGQHQGDGKCPDVWKQRTI